MDTIVKGIISVMAIFALTCIEIYAMKNGIDGTALAGAMAIIGAIAGNNLKPLAQVIKSLKKSKQYHG